MVITVGIVFLLLFLGISERNYTDEKLEEQNKKENEAKEYTWKDLRGVEHTNTFSYREALDRQRLLERNMRTTRSKASAFKVANQNEEYNVQKSRYRNQLALYKKFSNAMRY